MKFRIKKTAPDKSDKRDEKNPMWLIGTIIPPWSVAHRTTTSYLSL
ncbi:MAG: hypothetical protein AB8B73_14625 [Ekhidna sp.]